MTIAVCFRCGEMKHGAFGACGKCGVEPTTDDDLVLSLSMTDHYFTRPVLMQMGERVKAGNPQTLHPETRARLLADLRQMRSKAETMSGPLGDMLRIGLPKAAERPAGEPDHDSAATPAPQQPHRGTAERRASEQGRAKRWWQFWKRS